MIRAAGRAAVVATALWLTACPTDGRDLDCPQNPAVATAQEVFDDIQGPICSACHTPDNPAVPAQLPDQSTVTALRALVNADSRYGRGLKVVAPSNLRNSTLWLKVNGGSPAGYDGPNGAPVGGLMPDPGNGFDPLDAAQKDLLKRWICTGATG
jgi:mono/diheme cytochrome c family protein